MAIERFVWTMHAEERLSERGITRDAVELAIREGHPVHETNEGAADWRVDVGRFVVVYDHPHGDDINAVRIISVWSKRRRRRRGHSSRYPG
jgi:Domain of unknown function (DUF4258)